MLCLHGRGVVCHECHDTISRLCADLNESNDEIARLRAELEGARKLFRAAVADYEAVKRERDEARRERYDEAGRDYWCSACALSAQSNEGGTCLKCGGDLVHISEAITRMEKAELRAMDDSLRSEMLAMLIYRRSKHPVTPEMIRVGISTEKRLQLWAERVEAALRAHAAGSGAGELNGGVCEVCADGCYPYYGGAPGRDYAGPIEQDVTCTSKDGETHTIQAGTFVFAQRQPSPRETWPSNFSEDPECHGLGTWSCPACNGTGRKEGRDA